MFYADFVLSKKGPLARIWLAAHWDKKLTKAQIFETNLESSIETILKPKVKLALRTSGHLMLGVVRIYSRKTKYLLADCNEAFVKIKMAFRPGMVDLPDDHATAAVNAVTLPDIFHEFDDQMNDLDFVFDGNDIEIADMHFANLNQTRLEDITMNEDFNNLSSYQNEAMEMDESFASGFDGDQHQRQDITRHSQTTFDNTLRHSKLLMKDGEGNLQQAGPSNAMDHISLDMDSMGDGNLAQQQGMFEVGLFDDTPMLGNLEPDLDFPKPPSPHIPSPTRMNEDDSDDDHHFAPPSPVGSSDGSRPGSRMSGMAMPAMSQAAEARAVAEAAAREADRALDTQQAGADERGTDNQKGDRDDDQVSDQTTLLRNEEESFALAPVDASALKGLPKSKRKRKLIVDETKNISGEEMKAQLSDTSDIVTTLDLAPPTKQLMHWKETGGVEKLFALPGKHIPSRALFRNYQRNLVSRATMQDDQHGDEEHEQALPAPVHVPGKRGRKRKQPVEDVAAPTDAPAIEEMPPRQPDKRMAVEVNHLPVIEEEPVQMPQEPPVVPANFDSVNVNVDANAMEIDFGPNEISGQVSRPDDTFGTPTPFGDVTRIEENVGGEKTPFAENENLGFNVADNHGVVINSEENAIANNREEPSFGFNLGGTTPAGGATPWHDMDDDAYGGPMSVGPSLVQGEDGLMGDETAEQLEEKLLNKRAGQLYSIIRYRVQNGLSTTFTDLIEKNARKQVAQKFYSLLVLKKHKVLDLRQDGPYEEIILSPGSNFEDPTF